MSNHEALHYLLFFSLVVISYRNKNLPNTVFPFHIVDAVRLSSDAFVGQAANTTQPDFVVDEAFASLEEIEAQTIGDLLPDDDDLLSGAIHDLGYAAQSNKTDVEDDLFCSVGGMELESNDNFSFTKVSEYDYGGAFNSLGMGLSNLPTGNLPYGERSSRTLFVRNVDSNMEDMELRAFFEVFLLLYLGVVSVRLLVFRPFMALCLVYLMHLFCLFSAIW